jgi:hypothetical protein
MLRLITFQSICILVVSYPSRFFHYFPYAPNNIATFHVVGRLDFTVMVDNSKMIIVFEHYLCVMFAFQPSFLHISKDVSYGSNNFISSSLYEISTTSSQGRQWVVGFGCYCVVGDNLTHNSHKIILMLGTSYVVKFVKQENDVSHTFFQCSNVLTSSVFIELFDYSSSEDLIAPPSLIKSPKAIPQSTTQLSPQPSNLVSSIQFVVSCFRAMVLPRHTSNEL